MVKQSYENDLLHPKKHNASKIMLPPFYRYSQSKPLLFTEPPPSPIHRDETVLTTGNMLALVNRKTGPGLRFLKTIWPFKADGERVFNQKH